MSDKDKDKDRHRYSETGGEETKQYIEIQKGTSRGRERDEETDVAIQRQTYIHPFVSSFIHWSYIHSCIHVCTRGQWSQSTETLRRCPVAWYRLMIMTTTNITTMMITTTTEDNDGWIGMIGVDLWETFKKKDLSTHPRIRYQAIDRLFSRLPLLDEQHPDRQTDGQREEGWTDRETDGRRDGQTERQTDDEIYKETGRQTGSRTDGWPERQQDRRKDEQTDRETARQREMGRQTERRSDRRTNRRVPIGLNNRWP